MSTPASQLNLPPSAGAGQMPDLSSLLQSPQVPQYKPPDTSQYDKAAATGMGEAKAAEGQLQSLEGGAANLTDQAAKAYGSGIAAEDQEQAQMPSSAQFYAHAMKTAPLVAVMAALGGKAAGLSGQEMLGALNGMMSGFNAGSAQKYQESLARWQAGLKQLKERNAEQLEMYQLMLNAYQGRIDAAQKARDFALSVTGDAMSAKEAAVKDSIDIFSARAKTAEALSNHSIQLDKFLYSMMKSQKAYEDSKKTVDQAAQLIAGYKMAPLSSFVMKTPWGQQVMAKVAQLNPQYDATIYTARSHEKTTEGNIAGKIDYAEREIPKMSAMVEQISAQVPRDKFVPVNKLMQMGESSISDPQLRQLKIAINSMLNAYDVLAARGGTDVAKREEAHKLLTSADSPEALRAALNTFQREASIALQAAQESVGDDNSQTFSDEAAAEAAAKAGKIHPGDRIVVAGVSGTWQ